VTEIRTNTVRYGMDRTIIDMTLYMYPGNCFKLPYFDLIKRLFLKTYFGSGFRYGFEAGFEDGFNSGSEYETFILASDTDPDLTKKFGSLQILIQFRNTGNYSFRWRQSLISPLVRSYGNRQSWTR
jgi:hypothetical protein